MSVVYKVTITRPSFDSLCFMEMCPKDGLIISRVSHPSTYAGTITSYEPMITWSEIYARKHELRPDLLFLLDSIDIESITRYPNIYAPYPKWNPFSLSWTHLVAFDITVKEFTNIEKIIGSGDKIKEWIKIVGSTVTYEELLIDGIPDPTFVKIIYDEKAPERGFFMHGTT
jgi:hypothetical protein